MGNNVYGGLLCAQALAAAHHKAGSTAFPSSLHTYFVAFRKSHHVNRFLRIQLQPMISILSTTNLFVYAMANRLLPFK